MEQSAEPLQNSPSSPGGPRKMISPPNSVSGESNTSSDGFDHPTGISTEISRLTSYSTDEADITKSIEDNRQAVDIRTEMAISTEPSLHLEDGGTTPIPVDSRCRVRNEHVSVETLKTYRIDHFIDTDLDYVVITRLVPDYEMEFLKRHTEELKKQSIDPTVPQTESPSTKQVTHGSSGSLAPPHPQGSVANAEVQTPPYFNTTRCTECSVRYVARPPPPPPPGMRHGTFPNAPLSTVSDDSTTVKDQGLLVQVNKLPFSIWLDGQADDNKRDKCVLDVAMKASEATTPNSYDKRPTDEDPKVSETVRIYEVPVRVAINSELLRTQLNKIAGLDMNVDNKVMYPPWKVIVTYQEEIRKRLRDLEEKAAEHEKDIVKKEEKKPDLASVPSEEGETHLEPNSDEPTEGKVWEIVKACEVCDRSHATKFECLKDVVKHLKCFVDFIDKDLKHVFEFRQGLQDCAIKEIAFEDLWHLFTPGDLLITSGETHTRQAYRVFYTSGGRPTVRKSADFDEGPRLGPRRSMTYNDGPRSQGQKNLKFEKFPITTPFTIHCYYIDFDRRWLGPAHQIITVPRYEGKRPVTGLTMAYSDPTSRHPASAFPIRYLEGHDAVTANLVQRGKRHRQLTPFSHKKYIGPSSVVDPEFLNSEIIIDFEQQDLVLDSIGRFDEIWVNNEEVPEGCTLHETCYDCLEIFNDDIVDKEIAVRYKQDQHLLNKRDACDQNLTDDHYMLMRSEVNAWVLRERCIFGVYVDLVQDLDGDRGESLKELKKSSGFEDLVLPKGHGDLVEALVRMHRSTRTPRDEDAKVQVDLIDGKGEGLVILLHGVPGVGKTSTAECVAAYTQRPLYPITCANIGLDPEEVEEKLTGASGHFRRAQQWNCVVLLDEADVFLAKREARDNDSKRNALVSVFLRILEYYPGILILTTNRVGAFDEAVVSRIQLFLYYPPLDEEKTMLVWRVHINRVRASGLINIDGEDEDMIMDFAREEYDDGRRWNGRQIRNFFQTAISLASYDATNRRKKSIDEGRIDKSSKPERPRLTTRTLKIVAATSAKFIDYINATVADGSHQKQQLDEGNRNDSWEETPKKGLKKR